MTARLFVEDGRAFERAHRGSADGDYASAASDCLVDEAGCFFADRIFLKVHMVILDVFNLDGPESADPHMQRHIGCFDAFFPDSGQELIGKMQACRRCSHRAVLMRIDGLIHVPVLAIAGTFDVRRQWHVSQLLEALEKDAVVLKAHVPGSILAVALDGSLEAAVFAEGNDVPRP